MLFILFVYPCYPLICVDIGPKTVSVCWATPKYATLVSRPDLMYIDRLSGHKSMLCTYHSPLNHCEVKQKMSTKCPSTHVFCVFHRLQDVLCSIEQKQILAWRASGCTVLRCSWRHALFIPHTVQTLSRLLKPVKTCVFLLHHMCFTSVTLLNRIACVIHVW